MSRHHASSVTAPLLALALTLDAAAAPESMLPRDRDAAGCIAVGDLDGDGRKDVFIGGRVVPGRYPETLRSRLLRHTDSGLVDVRATAAPGLDNVGMVTAAAWSDLDGDGLPDLVVATAWDDEAIRFLLRRGPEAREAAPRAAGALVGGALQAAANRGFFCCSIDEAWREPHRQQHLADHARIAHAVFEAADAARQAEWKESSQRTLTFSLSHLRKPDDAFVEAIDRTDGAPDGDQRRAALLGAQGLLLAALWRTGPVFAGAAERLSRDLWQATPLASGAQPAASANLGLHDALGAAAGLAPSPHAVDHQHAQALTAYARQRFLDPRTGAFRTVPERLAVASPWRPMAVPAPLRPAAIALKLAAEPPPGNPVQRGLRHAIEFAPLSPADVLLALATGERSQ